MNLLKFIEKVEIGCKAFKFKISGTMHEYTEDSKRKTSIIFNQPEGIEDFKKEDYDELLKLIETKLLEEYEVFKKAGAITIRVEATREIRASRGELIGEEDITEVGLDNIKDWDFVIENNSSYENLKLQVNRIISRIKV